MNMPRRRTLRSQCTVSRKNTFMVARIRPSPSTRIVCTSTTKGTSEVPTQPMPQKNCCTAEHRETNALVEHRAHDEVSGENNRREVELFDEVCVR